MKRIYLKGITFLCATCSTAIVGARVPNKEHPNFVWFMAEDVSAYYLQLYNDNKRGVITPNLNKLAEKGIIFNNAYCNAPVSSAARTTLITGCFAPRLGTSFHRKLEQVPLPDGFQMFPSYLRKAGYHTSNAKKTDYNCFTDSSAWDVISGRLGEWRNRPNLEMPFFHVHTSTTTHESKLQFEEKLLKTLKTQNDPKKVFVHPNHPDTELFRYTYATFYDRIQDSDEELGHLMEMLKEDGELDNTFVFYFGDNGGALPFTKGYTSETGLHIPLVVYVPKKWRDRLSFKSEKKIDGFVSFVDFAPTLLRLAGIDIPGEMDGIPFLGEDISVEQLNKRNEVYGYGDRFDELYAFNRTVRKGYFKYSRNFLPYHPKSLYSQYRYRQATFREWKKLYLNGKLNELQSYFFKPQEVEELYDLFTDPYETKNLAKDPKYQSKLIEVRGLLKNQMIKTLDLGLFPECVWLMQGKQNPTQFGKANRVKIQRYSDIVDLELLTFRQAKPSILEALHSTDPVERYWGATVSASFGAEASPLLNDLYNLLEDTEAFVRSRAIVALSRLKQIDPVIPMKGALKDTKSGAESLLILNDMTYLKETGYDFKLNKAEVPINCTGTDWRIEYLK